MKLSIATFLLALTASAQQGSLPPNYKTIFENTDLLVMHVHYGAHEFVPMHDHTAYPTLYVYLNDSGPVKIIHEKPDNLILTRPPTHTGAFRLAPGAIERHSVQSLSDTPSDFLRVELKRIPPHDLKAAQHFAVPNPLLPGTHVEFQDKALRIERIICPTASSCSLDHTPNRSLLIALKDEGLQTPDGQAALNAGDVRWVAGDDKRLWKLSGGAQFLRVVLLYP